MNDSMSILLATTILAVGGLGLFMYKSSQNDEKDEKEKEEYDEGSLFGDFWGFKDDDSDKNDNEDEVIEDFEEEIKPRRRTAQKTYRNKKSNGSSKRRYY